MLRDIQTHPLPLKEASRQLGFIRFRNIEDSKDFLERNHPYIYLYGPSAGDGDRSTQVRIAYSREREDRTRTKTEGDWTCRMVSLRTKSPMRSPLKPVV